MENVSAANNPFALMTDPASVRQMVESSEQLRKLSQRQCHPLDRAVIRSASAELAAFDSKIDRTTIYLPPEEEKPQSITRQYAHAVN
jgi:adenylate kinase